LHPTDEGSGGYILITFVFQGHLTLKIVNIVLQDIPSFHLHCEEVVAVPLEFSLRSKMIVKRIDYFMEISERILWERIKQVVGDPLKAGW